MVQMGSWNAGDYLKFGTERTQPAVCLLYTSFKSTPPPFLCRSITERLMKQGCKVEGVPGFYLDDSGRWTIDVYKRQYHFCGFVAEAC